LTILLSLVIYNLPSYSIISIMEYYALQSPQSASSFATGLA
jgi:hypothetical protein